MFELKDHLLDNARRSTESPSELKSCINSHGLYHPFQFVLRLSPEVHRRIASMPSGIVNSGDLTFDDVQAFSTYLHETIHWWQHVGSTIGLMMSLSYPAQAHTNYVPLKRLTELIGPQKSIRQWVERHAGTGGNAETPGGLANLILNNHYDIEFFRILISSPKNVPIVVEDPLFECVGHSFSIAYANILATLAGPLDSQFEVLPDPRTWGEEFRRLRSEKVKGFYYRSEVMVAPIGAKEIFEGQARFNQMQYLCFGAGGNLSWDEVHGKGMLTETYVAAFNAFLELAELDWPPTIDHPVVALFLLICDISLNPAEGFPRQLLIFKTFISDVDPGQRFTFLCRMVALKYPEAASSITRYSREEYLQVSEALCHLALIDPPLSVGETLQEWRTRSEGLKSLMNEYRTFQYSGVNQPIHVLFSHFLAFNEDKLSRPEVFCWPGAWMTGKRVSSEIVELFSRHSALFIDKEDDDGIFPRIWPNRDQKIVQEMFDTFYAVTVTYDMARQWISKQGPFQYDYSWLSSGTESDLKQFADRHFEKIFGVQPDRFQIL